VIIRDFSFFGLVSRGIQTPTVGQLALKPPDDELEMVQSLKGRTITEV
jgi:hypothetical protein